MKLLKICLVVNSVLLRPAGYSISMVRIPQKLMQEVEPLLDEKLTSSICEDLFMVDNETSGPEIITKVSHGSNRGDNKEMFSECAISKGHC